MTRSRSALVVTLVVPLCACQGPVGLKAPPGESSSSGATAASSSGSLPDRVPPEPFVLPEGCGDGVIVSGQYDCFMPVSLGWVRDELSGPSAFESLDLEGDGRDEIIAVVAGEEVAVVRWDGQALRLEPPVDSGDLPIPGLRTTTRWDWNHDGRRDLGMIPVDGRGTIMVHHGLGDAGLGPKVVEHQLPPEDWDEGSYESSGFPAPIDVDGDGFPEVLVSLEVGAIESANPIEDLTLFKRTGSTWEAVGEAHRWGPCGVLQAFAYGDFDGDGDEDIALLDDGYCDHYPQTYDPEFHRVWVLLADSEAGVLELGGWYLPGGWVWDAWIEAADVTGDGRVDLLVRVADHIECENPNNNGCLSVKVAMMRGLGDGSFEEGTEVDLAPMVPSYKFGALADLDGDGTREWVVEISGTTSWVVPFDLSTQGIAPLVGLEDPDDGWRTRFRHAVGDVNGDGVDDYVASASNFAGNDPSGYSSLMVSAP